jgi:hypothetical protein
MSPSQTTRKTPVKCPLLPALPVLFLLSLLSACSTPIEAVTDHDTQYDFSKVRNIAIQPFNRADPGSVRISDMQVARIDDALAEALRRKGFSVVEENSEADLYLTWHLVTQEKTDVRTYNSMSYYNCWRCGPAVSDVSVRQYTEGTFIVDLIDPQRNQSVWRSTIQSRLKSEPDPERSEERRREAAQSIFAGFPP